MLIKISLQELRKQTIQAKLLYKLKNKMNEYTI